MGLFSHTRSYLGIDLGTGSIKVVELSNQGGSPRLVTYGFADVPLEEVKFDVHETAARTAATLAKICDQSHVQTRKCIAALPTFSVFSSVLTLPTMNEKEVGQALAYEAKKIVPMPIEEMILDWKLLGEIKSETGRKEKLVRILLTAAPKNLVKRYLDIFHQAKLELISLETEAFALGRSLLGPDPGVALIVDVGALTSDLVIIENHVPILNRSIDVGGLTATKAVAQSLQIDQRRAEQFKRDVGVVTGSTSGVAKVIEVTFAPMVNEIKYALSLFRTESVRPVEKMILTGGSAFLPHLTEYLESIFQIRVQVGDPWSGVSYPTELKPVLEDIGPRFATAIGLALREFND